MSLLDEELVDINWFKKLVSAGQGLRLRLKYHWEEVLEERIGGIIWNSGVCIGGSRGILTKGEEGVWYLSGAGKFIWRVSSL